MSFRTQVRLLQYLLAVALMAIVGGFGTLIFSSMTATVIEGVETVPLVIGAGFGLALLTLPFLASTKCPACAELFCGPQNEDNATPDTNVFTVRCKYCGFSLDT